MRHSRPHRFRRLKHLAIGMLLALVVAEFSLRLFGAAYLLVNRRGGESAARGYTILVLGESTTALSRWPELLGKHLQTRLPGRSWSVINEGIPGTTTSHIVLRLPGLLDRYRPDMVITMIGVNDRNANLVPVTSAWQNGTRMLEDMRLVKAVRLLGSLLNRKPGDSRLWGKPAAADAATMARYHAALEQLEGGKPAEAEALLRELTVEESPVTNAALLAIGRAYTAQGKHREAVAAYEQVGRREGWPDSDIVQTASAYRDMGWSDGEINERLRQLVPGISVRVDTAVPVEQHTAENYRTIHRILTDRGIPHAVMQYPTLPLTAVRGYFPPTTDILFIENVSNFAPVLAAGRYADVFTDTFGVTWGHTTAYGDELIASRAAETLVSYFTVETP